MASGVHARQVTIGISGGLGVLVPAAAFAITIPFEGVHDVVSAGAAPFAIGAVAGVGALALTTHLYERRAAAGDAQDASDSGSGRQAAKDRTSVKGVPVISRAANAMSDDEAWAQLDELLAEDSPVSCDPARSKDVYQIALEELARAQETAETAPAGTPAAVAPDSTAAYVALALGDASAAPEAAPADEAASADAAARGHAGFEPADGEFEFVASDGADDIWARALAIMADEEPVAADPAAQADLPMGAHFAPVDAGATAQGGAPAQASGVPDVASDHVDELVQDELRRMRSKDAQQRQGFDWRVISGGTAVLPRLQAEA